VLRWAIEHGCPVSEVGGEHFQHLLA